MRYLFICIWILLFHDLSLSQINWDLSYEVHEDTVMIFFQGTLEKEKDEGSLNVVRDFYQELISKNEYNIVADYFNVKIYESKNIFLDTSYCVKYSVKKIDSLNIVQFRIVQQMSILDNDKPVYIKGIFSFVDVVYKKELPYFIENNDICYILSTDLLRRSIKVGCQEVRKQE
jgi:hypothetical protein